MIKFTLSCDAGHLFEGWFARNADFEEQAARGLVSCPSCGSVKVDKALMAPSVSTARRKAEKASLALNTAQADEIAKVRQMVAAIRASSEDVGDRFPEEARKIHYGESDPRGIIGKAAPEEAHALAEEGISFAPLPRFPDEAN